MKGGTELLDQLPGEDAVQRNVPLVCVCVCVRCICIWWRAMFGRAPPLITGRTLHSKDGMVQKNELMGKGCENELSHKNIWALPEDLKNLGRP